MSKPTAVVVGVGAEQGLGAAACRRFAKKGHHVLVAGRTSAKIEQVVHPLGCEVAAPRLEARSAA
jgi:NAD(P)-dependent dehydrogenase (short-subunit alcohol dehydrogenase family)